MGLGAARDHALEHVDELRQELDPAQALRLPQKQAKGIEKFVAHEVPLELAQARYGGHFNTVERDLRQADDLRVLDFDGQRAFRLFRFAEPARRWRTSPDTGGVAPRPSSC